MLQLNRLQQSRRQFKRQTNRLLKSIRPIYRQLLLRTLTSGSSSLRPLQLALQLANNMCAPFAATMRPANTMALEPAKAAKAFLNGRYKKTPNTFVQELWIVLSINGAGIGASIAASKSALKLEWYAKVSVQIVLRVGAGGCRRGQSRRWTSIIIIWVQI